MPDDTRELVDLAVFHRGVLLAAALLLVGGLVGGWFWGRKGGRARAGLLRGLAVGLTGPVLLALWTAYNALEDHYGLDSVRALGINLALFVIVGILGGAALGCVWRRTGTD